MIHIIRVKLGTSFHLLMPESKPMLSPSERQISFFLRDPSSAFTCSSKGCDNFCEALMGVSLELSHRHQVAVAFEDGKNQNQNVSENV